MILTKMGFSQLILRAIFTVMLARTMFATKPEEVEDANRYPAG